MATCAVAVDHSGNLVIANSHFDRVQVVAAATGRLYGQAMIAGDINIVAGDGTAMEPGTAALPSTLNSPRWTARGDLVVATSLATGCG